MGVEVSKSHFKNNDYSIFADSLEKETLLLRQWLNEKGVFEDNAHSFGLEVEAWILDSNGLPYAMNDSLLNQINHKQVVPELSQYNIELNSEPEPLSPLCFARLEKGLIDLWKLCNTKAEKLNGKLLLGGTAPTLEWEMLKPHYMTKGNRYKAVAGQLYKKLHQNQTHIYIKGKDSLSLCSEHVIVASAATSIQPHWKIPVSQAQNYFNVSHIVSPIISAVSANCPYLFKKSLWEESRVPFFEQSIDSSPFHRGTSKRASRAIFGHHYLNSCISEFFMENLGHHTPLLPLNDSCSLSEFHHLNLHNSTIWRWNRPIIGRSASGQYHVRLEHRVPSAGPTIKDSIATMAFFVGLTHELVQNGCSMTKGLPFGLVKENFYRASRDGLNAQIHWFNRKKVKVRDLVLSQLLPMAHLGLMKLGIQADEIKSYLGVIQGRTQTGQTGSAWQRAQIENKGCFSEMTLKYLENQASETPVHLWSL